MIFKHSKTDNPAVYGCMEIVAGLFLGAIFCLIISLCSCKPTKEMQIERVEVPVVVEQEHHTENVRVDIVRDTIRQRDSVVYRDSIYHYIKGDTTIIERWHYVTNNHHYTDNNNKVRVDTLLKVDSVQVPIEVVRESVKTEIKEVNKLTWAQKTLMGFGGIAILAGAIFIAYKIRRK